MMETGRLRKRVTNWGCVVLAALVLGVFSCAALAQSDDEAVYEYRVKAAFMYNFLVFVDGLKFQQELDEKDETEADRTVVIGIVGADPFGEALEPLRQKRIKDLEVVIKHFRGFSELRHENAEIKLHPDLQILRACDLLFIASSEEPYLNLILAPIRNEKILTVAETPAFVEKGGMIGLVTERHKVRFEVNVAAARQAGLVMRSKLLRLARRVVGEDDTDDR